MEYGFKSHRAYSGSADEYKFITDFQVALWCDHPVFCSAGQKVKTLPFHGKDMGSIPVRNIL